MTLTRHDPIARMNAGRDVARAKGSTGGTNHAVIRKASDFGPPDNSPELSLLAVQINAAHEAVATALTSSVEHAIIAGEALLLAKSKISHGGWADWIRDNTAVSERSARGYMQLAKLDPAKRRLVADSDQGLRAALSSVAQKLAPPKPNAPAPAPEPTTAGEPATTPPAVDGGPPASPGAPVAPAPTTAGPGAAAAPAVPDVELLDRREHTPRNGEPIAPSTTEAAEIHAKPEPGTLPAATIEPGKAAELTTQAERVSQARLDVLEKAVELAALRGGPVATIHALLSKTVTRGAAAPEEEAAIGKAQDLIERYAGNGHGDYRPRPVRQLDSPTTKLAHELKRLADPALETDPASETATDDLVTVVESIIQYASKNADVIKAISFVILKLQREIADREAVITALKSCARRRDPGNEGVR